MAYTFYVYNICIYTHYYIYYEYIYIYICLVNEGYHIIQQAQLGAPHPIKPHYFDSTPSNGNTTKYDYVDPINPIVVFVSIVL